MKSEYSRYSKTKYFKDNGATMIVAIIIIAVIMIFAFSLMLVTYTLYASQNKNVASQRNREAANSLSIALKNELESETAYNDSWLWKYLRCNLYQDNTWPYYDPSDIGHDSAHAFRYFNLKKNANYDVDGYPGDIKLCMYWCLPDGVSISNADKVSEISIDKKNNAYLYIEIICETASQKYTKKDIYIIDVSGFDSNSIDDVSKKSNLEIMSRNKIYNPMNLYVNPNEKWELKHDI